MEPNVIYGLPVPSEWLTIMNLPINRYIRRCAEEIPNSVCMIDGVTGEELTIESVLNGSTAVAVELQALGCKSGDVVGINCENRLEIPTIVLGILNTGATVCCFNPTYSIGELEHTLKITQPSIIFTSSYAVDNLQRIRQKTRYLKRIIHLDANKTDKSYLAYKDIINCRNLSAYVQPDTNGESTSLILFSSGSTGLPKGVMLSSRSLILLMEMMRFRNTTISPKNYINVRLSVIPMFHGYGVLLLLQKLVTRQTLIILKKFDEEVFLSVIQRYKVTSLSLVPALMVFLAKHKRVDQYDLSSVKEITCGAAPLSPDVEMEVKRKLGLSSIIKGYGMTETTILCTSTFLSDDKHGSVGRLSPAMSAKVIDLQTGEALGANKEGELCFRGLFIMQGYYNNKTESNATIDQDGWLHTGDVGYYDEDGDFFIVDRIKDLIKYKGFQVAPAELEAILLKHDAVKDSAVIGIPDEIAGEIPRAFVVKQKDVTEKELIEFVSENVAPHMKLRGGIFFINEIPRNPNGKILRRELRNWSRSKL